MLFWVASYPRSGNGFFRELVSRLCNVSSTVLNACPGLMQELLGASLVQELEQVRLRQAGRVSSTGAQGQVVTPPPVLPCPDWADRPLAEVMADPRTFSLKSHYLLHETGLPAVYLVRDGRDALVSYARFTPAHGPEISPEQFRKNLIRKITVPGGHYGHWSENVRAWIRRPRTCVLRFEEFIERPLESVQHAIDTLQLPIRIGQGEVPTFEELQATYPDIFRRGKVGSWQDEFPADLLPLFWEHHGEMMRELGYAERCAA